MAGLSTAYRNKVNDHIFKIAALAQPTTLYLGLSTADPLDDATGLAEPVGNGYARVLCSTAFAASASGSAATDEVIAFLAATGNWGTCTHVALFDAIAGTMICSGPLQQAKQIQSGDTPSFSIGQLTHAFSSP